jgi:cell wall-associated NlpC family hydrolase
VLFNCKKYLFSYVLAISTTFALYAFKPGGEKNTVAKIDLKTAPDSVKIDTLLKRAYSVMGTTYKWAGATPETGFDCSGYVQWCYKPLGILTARSSSGLYNMGKKIEFEDAQPGDLILFKGTNAKTKGVGHVGMVVSKKGEPLKFVQCSSSKAHWGVVETEYGGSYYVKRYIGIRRIL